MGVIVHPGKRTARTRDIEYTIDGNECWVVTSHACTGANYGQGYPRVCINGKVIRLNRFSFETYKGPIPNEMCICHSCDNPACINPEHLFLGTRDDNNKDKKAKGRSSRGVNRPLAKLNEIEVKNIRSLYSEGISQRFLARFFGVSHSTVSKIIIGKSWGWLQEGTSNE